MEWRANLRMRAPDGLDIMAATRGSTMSTGAAKTLVKRSDTQM